MRLHRNLVYTTIDALNAIFNEGEYADKVVPRSLKKDKRWGSSDRKFVAETIYEVVRWKRLYSEIADVKSRPEQLEYYNKYGSVIEGIIPSHDFTIKKISKEVEQLKKFLPESSNDRR